MRRDPLESLLDLLALSIAKKGLGSLLFFDTSPLELEWIADLLEPAWRSWAGDAVSRAYLSPFHTEEDLWGTGPGLLPGMTPDGLLFPRDAGRRIVIVPDLSEAGPVVSRALIQCLGGGEAVHLERHGRQEQRASERIWIAACPSKSVGKVSKHVLDRFTLRPPRLTFDARDRENRLKRRIRFEEERSASPEPGPMQSLHDKLRRNLDFLKVSSAVPENLDAQLKVLAQLPSDGRSGLRRYLTAARLSVGLAQLAHKDSVLHALQLMQWRQDPEDDPEEHPRLEDDGPEPIQPDLELREPTTRSTDPVPGSSDSTMDPGIRPAVSAAATIDDDVFEAVLIDPFPEDQALGEREPAALRFEAARGSSKRRERGAVIGSEPVPGSAPLDDLALIPTLMAALPFQKLRRQSLNRTIDDRLALTRDDLRRRRRAPQARRLLVMVADATALVGADRLTPWMPYIRQAYVDRSRVCVVLVGGRDAPHELRAEAVNARSVLVPEVEAALSRPAGVATPLAHGLHLVLETLRKARNRDGIETVNLVVLSDGRGNIPLDAGLSGRLPSSVGCRGIWDALEIAEKIAAMRPVEAWVLDPQPAYGSHLVGELADALGAEVLSMATGSPP